MADESFQPRVRWLTAGDPELVDYTDLTDVALRKVLEPREGLFMAESLEVIDRALRAHYRPRSVLTGERWLPDVATLLARYDARDTPVYVAPDDVLRLTTGFRMHRGPMAAMQRRPLPPPRDVLRDAARVLVLDGLVDHTNVGAAFRSAAALGVDTVLVDTTCADPLYRRSVRVSMGTVFAVPWTRTAAWWRDLAGFRTVALTPAADAIDIAEVPRDGRLALVVGSEGPGLAPDAQRRASVRARIPMAGDVDSLNAAAAVAVAVYVLTSGGPARKDET